jgi:hypothetical protein
MGGGTIFRILCRCFGWKFARRCQLAWHFVQKGESTADSIKSPSATCQTT